MHHWKMDPPPSIAISADTLLFSYNGKRSLSTHLNFHMRPTQTNLSQSNNPEMLFAECSKQRTTVRFSGLGPSDLSVPACWAAHSGSLRLQVGYTRKTTRGSIVGCRCLGMCLGRQRGIKFEGDSKHLVRKEIPESAHRESWAARQRQGRCMCWRLKAMIPRAFDPRTLHSELEPLQSSKVRYDAALWF